MSVRRLDPIQPDSFAFTAENMAFAQKTIAQYPAGKQASAVIALLWRAQEQNAGWLSRPAMEYVGQMLDMSFIRVYEVATFYTMFQLSPVGKIAHVQVCGTTPCMLRGANDLKKVCEKKIGAAHHVSADGKFSWEEVECLGACVNAPMVQIHKETFEDLTPESLTKLLEDLEAGRPVKPGPQNGRQLSAPEGGPQTLTDPELYKGPRKFTRIEAAPPPPPAPAPAPAPAAAAPTKPETKPALVATESAGSETKPELLAKPKDGKPDDLKLIWGVGPKLATMLNEMGVWHFSQIASWSDAELSWVDARLTGFKGRARRDDWISQAQKLATGWRPESAAGDKPGKK